MNNSIIKAYHEYRDKTGDRKALYRSVAVNYDITNALYPGSHIDIAPSLVIPKVIYVDNFKGTIKFFKNMDLIKNYVTEHKAYAEPCELIFLDQDYRDALNIEPVQLVISQYAGFVGQATKRYLKLGGLLLCNDSHGDATLARFDSTFDLVGVMDHDYQIIDTKLDDYFVLPRGENVNLVKVKEKMKGPKYKLSAENYLFRKIK